MRRIALSTVFVFLAALPFSTGLVALGCAADKGRSPTDGGVKPTDGNTIHLDDLAVNQDAFFINDPPPMYCGLDGGFTQPSPPGGTLQCPDDKNLEGCPCPMVGTTAACWPGLRINRGLGNCRDGMTTCTQTGEINPTWGPCTGAVLPVQGASSGTAACRCFSHGLWNVDNVSPCLVGDGTTTTMAWSTTPPATDGGTAGCTGTPPAPSEIWAHDDVTADCAGHFKLCFTIKAFSKTMPSPTPQATDCIVSQSCATSDYTTPNVVQSWPDLPSWVASASASSCIMQFATTGGYGEMSVVGETVTCDQIPQHVFQTVTYCAPSQTNCSSGGGGQF